jgi:hypothetical protein
MVKQLVIRSAGMYVCPVQDVKIIPGERKMGPDHARAALMMGLESDLDNVRG